MNTLILTGYVGEHYARMAEHTVPLMISYAARHGAAFECRNLAGPKPPSWLKVPALHNALDSFDAALWIDIDVVILDPSESIFAAADPTVTAQALVEHKTECGLVPNCGVWMVTPLARPLLKAIWEEGRNTNHPWWEQASVLEKMGYEVNGVMSMPASRTPLADQTVFLPPAWNHHPNDERACDIAGAKFVHVTQYHDRIGVVEGLAQKAIR